MASVEYVNGPENATQILLKEHTSSVVTGSIVNDGASLSEPKVNVIEEPNLNEMDASKDDVEGIETEMHSTAGASEKEPYESEVANRTLHDAISDVANLDVVPSNHEESEITHDASNEVDADETEPTDLIQKDQAPAEPDLKEISSAEHTAIFLETPEPTLLPHREESDSVVQNAGDAETPTSVRQNVQSEEPGQDTARDVEKKTSFETDLPLGEDNLVSLDTSAEPQSEQRTSVEENLTESVSTQEDVPIEAPTMAGGDAIPATSGTEADESLVVDAGSLSITSMDQEHSIEGNVPDPRLDESLVADLDNLQVAEGQEQSVEENKSSFDAGAHQVDLPQPTNDVNPITQSGAHVQSSPVVHTTDSESTIYDADSKEEVPLEAEVSEADDNVVQVASETTADNLLVVDASSLAATSFGQEQDIGGNVPDSQLDESLVQDVDNLQVAEDQEQSAGENENPLDADSHQVDLSQSTNDMQPITQSVTQVFQPDPTAHTIDSESTINDAESKEDVSLETEASVADSNAIPATSGTEADKSLSVGANQEQSIEGNVPDPKLDESLVADVDNLQVAEDQKQSAEEHNSSLDAGAHQVDPSQSTNDVNPVTQSVTQVIQLSPVVHTIDSESTINDADSKDVPLETEVIPEADSNVVQAASETTADNSLVVNGGSLATTSVDRDQSLVGNDPDPKMGESLVADSHDLQVAEEQQPSVGESKSTPDAGAHQDVSQLTNDANLNTESETQTPHLSALPPTTNPEFTAEAAVLNDGESVNELVEEQAEVVPELRSLVTETEGEPIGGEDTTETSAPDLSLSETNVVDALPAAPDTTVSDTAEQETPAQTPEEPVDHAATGVSVMKDSVTGGGMKQEMSVAALEFLPGAEVADALPTALDKSASEPTEKIDAASAVGEQHDSEVAAGSGIRDECRGESEVQAEQKAFDGEESTAEGEMKEDVGTGSLESPPESKVVDALPAAPDAVVSDAAQEDEGTAKVVQDVVNSQAGEAPEQTHDGPLGQVNLNTVPEEIGMVDTTPPIPEIEAVKPFNEASQEPAEVELSTQNDVEQLNASDTAREFTGNTAPFDPTSPGAPATVSEAATPKDSESTVPEAVLRSNDETQDESDIQVVAEPPISLAFESKSSPEPSADIQISSKDEIIAPEDTTVTQSSAAEECAPTSETETSEVVKEWNTDIDATNDDATPTEMTQAESPEISGSTTTEISSTPPAAESSESQPEEIHDSPDSIESDNATEKVTDEPVAEASVSEHPSTHNQVTPIEPATEPSLGAAVATDRVSEEKHLDTLHSNEDVTQNQIEEATRDGVRSSAAGDTAGEDEQETRVDEDRVPQEPRAAPDQTKAADESARIVEKQDAKQGQEISFSEVDQMDSGVAGEAEVSSAHEDVEAQRPQSTETASHIQVAEEMQRPKSPWTPSYSVTSQGPGITAEEETPEIESKPVVEYAPAVNEAPIVNVVAFAPSPFEGIALEDKRNDEPPRPWTPSYSVSSQGSPALAVSEEAPKQEGSHTDDAAKSAEGLLPVGATQEASKPAGVQEQVETSELLDSQAVPDEENAPVHNAASSDTLTQLNDLAQEPVVEVEGRVVPAVEVSEPYGEFVEETKRSTGAASVSGEATSKAPDSFDDSSAPARPASPWTQSYSVSVQGSPQPSSKDLPNESAVENQVQTIQLEEAKLPNQDLHNSSVVISPSHHDSVTSITDKITSETLDNEETPTGDHFRGDNTVANVSSFNVLAAPGQMEVPSEQIFKSTDASRDESVTSTTNVVPDDTTPVSQERDGSQAVDGGKNEAADVLSSKTIETTDIKEPLPSLESAADAPQPESKSPWASSYSVTKQGSDPFSEDVAVTSAPSQPETKDVDSLSAPATATSKSNKLNSLTVDTSSASAENTPQRPRSPWTPSYSVMRQGAGSTDVVDDDAELAKLEQLPEPVAQSVEAPRVVEHDHSDAAESDQGLEPFPTSASYEEEGSLTSLDTVTGDSPSSPSGRSRLESTASSLMFPGGWFSKAPPGRASLDNARGEFVASKQSSPVERTPEVPEETPASSESSPPTDATSEETAPKEEEKEKKSKWCTIM
ncbi:hypothetical protein E1B28_011435 [Marasmius oreades]|uniref:Uncharacterized protein n=1 Tax=Marasmius oreades TaxID=181124 RepID=A0A9P7RU27_9AGAR|nr:uncharacterized protein E1B28_011435 [Marasmius oreades]KAG7089784.1 hypothetical protein E1B28_011435 [Marasmius oreades]